MLFQALDVGGTLLFMAVNCLNCRHPSRDIANREAHNVSGPVVLPHCDAARVGRFFGKISSWLASTFRGLHLAMLTMQRPGGYSRINAVANGPK